MSGERVETGVVQFGDDWPGVFVRGDECMGLAINLGLVLGALAETCGRDSIEYTLAHASVGNFRKLLFSADAADSGAPVRRLPAPLASQETDRG